MSNLYIECAIPLAYPLTTARELTPKVTKFFKSSYQLSVTADSLHDNRKNPLWRQLSHRDIKTMHPFKMCPFRNNVIQYCGLAFCGRERPQSSRLFIEAEPTFAWEPEFFRLRYIQFLGGATPYKQGTHRESVSWQSIVVPFGFFRILALAYEQPQPCLCIRIG